MMHYAELSCSLHSILSSGTDTTFCVSEIVARLETQHSHVHYVALLRTQSVCATLCGIRATQCCIRTSEVHLECYSVPPLLPGDARLSSCQTVADLINGRIPLVPSGGTCFVDVRDTVSAASLSGIWLVLKAAVRASEWSRIAFHRARLFVVAGNSCQGCNNAMCTTFL